MDQRGAFSEFVGAFLRGHALIAATKPLACDEHKIDFIRFGINGPSDTFFIESERNVPNRFPPIETDKYLGAVSHFRDGPG